MRTRRERYQTVWQVIGNNIKTRRRDMELKQVDLAAELGCSLDQVRYVEWGRRSLPVELLPKLQEVLEIEDYRVLLQPRYFV